MESKIKHLEFIQSVINRMANNSFLLKGWTITLVGGLYALSSSQQNTNYQTLSFGVVVLFWLLDSYYLSQERCYVKLYNQVRIKLEQDIDFQMSAITTNKWYSWPASIFSRTMLMFYGGILILNLFIFRSV